MLESLLLLPNCAFLSSEEAFLSTQNKHLGWHFFSSPNNRDIYNIKPEVQSNLQHIRFQLLNLNYYGQSSVTISSLYNCMYPLMYISWPVQEWIVMADEQNTSGQYI